MLCFCLQVLLFLLLLPRESTFLRRLTTTTTFNQKLQVMLRPKPHHNFPYHTAIQDPIKTFTQMQSLTFRQTDSQNPSSIQRPTIRRCRKCRSPIAKFTRSKLRRKHFTKSRRKKFHQELPPSKRCSLIREIIVRYSDKSLFRFLFCFLKGCMYLKFEFNFNGRKGNWN